jgi:hypothetical protein
MVRVAPSASGRIAVGASSQFRDSTVYLGNNFDWIRRRLALLLLAACISRMNRLG